MRRCCNSCSFCNFSRAAAKERPKTRSLSEKNKACRRCFLCKSLSFCPICSKCPTCCHRDQCWGKASELLASLAKVGFKSQGSVSSEGRIFSSIQGKATSQPLSLGCEQVRKSHQKQGPRGSSIRPKTKTSSGKGGCPVFPGFLQPTFSGPKTQWEMETNSGSKQTQSFPSHRHFQDGNPGDNSFVSAKRGMGHVAGFQRRLLPHSHSSKVQEISKISPKQGQFSVHFPSLWSGHGSLGVHQSGQRGQVDSSSPGYPDPPVPRRLVVMSPFPGNLPTTYPDPLGPVSRVGLVGKHAKIRAGSPTSFQLRRLPVRPVDRSSLTHSGPVVNSQTEGAVHQEQEFLHRPAVHVSDRSSDCHREASLVRAPSYEAYSVALETPLACTGNPREGDSGARVTPSSFRLVAGRRKRASGSIFASASARSTSLYRRFKQRLGRSLRRLHCKRRLVRARTKTSHKFSGAQSCLSGPKELRASLSGSNCSDCHRQYNGGLLHQQGRGYEIRLSLCPPVENSDLVPLQGNSSEGPAHSGSLECDSRQAVETQSGDSNRVVSGSTGVWSVVLQVVPSSSRLVCHQFQSQTPQVCFSGSGSEGLGSGRPKSIMGEPGRVCLSSGISSQPGGLQDGGSRFSQNDSSGSGMAEHALVLGPSKAFSSGALSAPTSEELGDSTVQRGSSPEPQQSEPTCLAPRACSIKQQGFTKEVATRIEAPQRLSTRAVYKSKWAIFVKWCDSHEVDFRSPSISQIAEFLLYLFKERNLQPSTIEGYRTAIADMVGNDRLAISKDENLSRLLDSFHRDKPKGRRGIPSWNLSLVLHQLTKAPFEPLRKASLKHLTFKTVFLLALGSGKRRSEIHAWLFKNIRHQENWTQVSFYPSPSFISKNQLAKEGSASVAPVVIPALAPSLDRSLKEDKSLCPVRALRYYLDRTKDIRVGKELVFVSFRLGFQKDIVPATISSWIKQTVLLCYQLSDEEAQNLHQVRAHDVRAFAASKAFQGGVSLDQILSACHWKAHNTFTQFYLKDLAWADSELYHLGPIVAAQQVHRD